MIEAIDPVRFISNHLSARWLRHCGRICRPRRRSDCSSAAARPRPRPPPESDARTYLSAVEMWAEAATARLSDGATERYAGKVIADYTPGHGFAGRRKSKSATAGMCITSRTRTSPQNWAHAKAAACWWASRSRPRRTGQRRSQPLKKTSTSSSSPLFARRRSRIPRRHQQSHLHRPKRPGRDATDAEIRGRGAHRR